MDTSGQNLRGLQDPNFGTTLGTFQSCALFNIDVDREGSVVSRTFNLSEFCLISAYGV